MKNAVEYYVPPAAGKYPADCVAATAVDDESGSPLLSKAGSTMIKLTWRIAEGPGAGAEATDHIITDGNDPKAGGMGKIKLRALGVDVDSDIEIPDTHLCSTLLNRRQTVDFGNEPLKTKESNFKQDATYTDPKTGRVVVLQKLTIKGYVSALAAPTGQHAVVQPITGAQVAGAPVAPPAAFAPAQFMPQLAQAPQYAQPAPVVPTPTQQLAAPPPGWQYARDAAGQPVLVPVQQQVMPQPVAPAAIAGGQPPQAFYPTAGVPAPQGLAQAPIGWPPAATSNGEAVAAADTTAKKAKKMKLPPEAPPTGG